MDQLSRSGVGSDVTDETASVGDVRWSSEESLDSEALAPCLVSPQAPPTSYKQRNEEFKKLFKELPESEKLIVDYTCALQRDILLQGRLYLSENWLCFYSNMFRGTKMTMPLIDIKSMCRVKTAGLIPTVQVNTDTEKLFFTSVSSREKIYQGVFRMWQNTLLDKPLTCAELWQMVKQHYGNELGLSNEEMERLSADSPTPIQSNSGSLTMKPGVEEHGVKLERPTHLRLNQGEAPSGGGSTPQGEEKGSLGLLTTPSGNTERNKESHSPLSRRRTPEPVPDRSAPEKSALGRSTPDRVPKNLSASLDQNANEGRVSEQSASESADEVETRVPVPGSLVQGRLYVNRVFCVSAEKMFQMLFTDSHFMRRFMAERKITGSSFPPWKKEESGSMRRKLNYTITITNPLVGKFSRATENQVLCKESREGQYYLVDAEVYTHDVPYHDYFYTQLRYCIIRHSKRKCRLRICTDVKYKKQPWGLVKSFITKNSWSGLEEYLRHLEAELLEEEAELTQGGGDSGKMGPLRRRRRTYSRTLSDHLKPSKQYGSDSEQRRESSSGGLDLKVTRRWSLTTFVAGMSFILLILTVLNLGLFFKLWAMEDVAHRMHLSTKHRLRVQAESSLPPDFGSRSPPPHRTNEEMQLLKTVLEDSINLLEQLRSSLMALQLNFAVHNRTIMQQD